VDQSSTELFTADCCVTSGEPLCSVGLRFSLSAKLNGATREEGNGSHGQRGI
jgi:hypothetical protein